MKPELFNEQSTTTTPVARKYQDEMRELAKAMPILHSQLATWAGAMDALQKEVESQATVIVTQAQQLDYCDDEIDRLGKVNNELRKRLNTDTTHEED